MSKNIAVFLYNFTKHMPMPWAEAGYECWCFDSQHPSGITVDGNYRFVGGFLRSTEDVWKHVDKTRVAFVAGFPPCTDLAVSGAKHFEVKRGLNANFQLEAAALAYLVRDVGQECGAPWMAENPISVLSTLWRKPDWKFHPSQFGGYLPEDDVHPDYPEYIAPRDAYRKTTCLWAGNGFKLPKKKPVYWGGKGFSLQTSQLGGKSQFTKNVRSATPRGFAMAVFLAYGEQL